METTVTVKNWEIGDNSSVLKRIHDRELNIVLFERDIAALKHEITNLITRDIEFRASGDLDAVLTAIGRASDLNDFPLIKGDLESLLHLFLEVTETKSYRLFFATISSNMCRKFHTDINDLRMLCTYEGPGTLWLTEDNVNQAMDNCGEAEECLVIDESRIQQANTGTVVILKGAIYPKKGTKPILHRSPTIEENSEKRVLLRIDTDNFASF
ncbi:MAG: DUF1826 domain-containing protein [Cyclobacteriaceae bacterium]|nr:DUF1826 domain-containing protein [Cyclobacteriaceae bacterium HetDA_MAG_MS6]